jgi:drug/metabolite transporter (DMT)-like permease
MSYTFVNPVVALGLGSAFGAEHFTFSELMATAIICAGILFLLGNHGVTGSGNTTNATNRGKSI